MTNAAASPGGVRPGISVVFDVTDLERTRAFYEAVLGFEVVRKERVGAPYETWFLASKRHPGFDLAARKSYRRPVVGSLLGSLVRITITEPPSADAGSFAARAKLLEGKVRWTVPLKEGAKRVAFVDPDGYEVELREG